MAISLKHNFQSAVADGGDTTLVQPSNWNAEHDLTLATARLIGRTSSGTGSAEEISVGTGLNLSSGSLAVSSTTPQVNSINTFTAAQVIEVTDNSNPALRITQIGTADALRVEDDTNPDSTPFVITAAGHAIAGSGTSLAIATTYPQFQSHTTTLAEGGYGGADWGNTATGQVSWFAKSRGGSYGAQAIVQSGDTIGDFRFYGSDGTAFIPAARIQVAVDGTPGSNDMPGRLVFYTTADGAATVSERLRIANNGAIGIGGANYGSSGQFLKSAGSGAAPSWASIANTDVSGLGTMSTQNANNVAITGGSITGITDLAVADGGTGASSFTAYSVILGGTTGTGALQNVSGLGNSGQVLTSAGAGAPPTWATPSASAADGIFWENNQTVTTNYTVTAGKNAGTFGPITINSGVTVTVPSNSTWTIV